MKNEPNQRKLLIVMRGILAIILGLLALIYPQIALIVLAIGFGTFTLIGGTFLVIASLQSRQTNEFRGFWLFEGLLDTVIGLVILLNPRFSVPVFLALLGVWAILGGIVMLSSYNKLRRFDKKFPGVLLLSILSILFGIIILLNPFGTALSITILIGIYIIIYGTISIFGSGKLMFV